MTYQAARQLHGSTTPQWAYMAILPVLSWSPDLFEIVRFQPARNGGEGKELLK